MSTRSNAPLRRPLAPALDTLFKTTAPKNISVEPLLEQLRNNDIEKCLQIFESLTPSEEATVAAIKQLYEETLLDFNIGRKMALFLNKSIKGPRGSFIRAQWLLLMQANFERREETMLLEPEKFLHLVHFHGEVYHVLLVEKEPLKALAAPLLVYFTLLLKLTKLQPMNFQVLLVQLVLNNKHLKEQEGPAFQTFGIEIRKELLIRAAPELLLAIDIINNGFPEGSLREYYEKILPVTFKELECRYLGKPSMNGTANLRQNKTLGIFIDADAVRDRMRAKGLIPVHSSSIPKTLKEN